MAGRVPVRPEGRRPIRRNGHLAHRARAGTTVSRGSATRSPLGVDGPVFIKAELTLAREAPAMIPLELDAEDKSMAGALAAIGAVLEV
jgi:hypothetical protein